MFPTSTLTTLTTPVTPTIPTTPPTPTPTTPTTNHLTSQTRDPRDGIPFPGTQTRQTAPTAPLAIHPADFPSAQESPQSPHRFTQVEDAHVVKQRDPFHIAQFEEGFAQHEDPEIVEEIEEFESEGWGVLGRD
ncbi:hypothetical protein NHQ30_009507 [Ciborinia camelliae]|nr:hypothetical protein NHQ30_009507 [Ciborinia camelliae]